MDLDHHLTSQVWSILSKTHIYLELLFYILLGWGKLLWGFKKSKIIKDTQKLTFKVLILIMREPTIDRAMSMINR